MNEVDIFLEFLNKFYSLGIIPRSLISIIENWFLIETEEKTILMKITNNNLELLPI